MLRQSWSQPSLWLHTVTSRLVSEHVRTVHFTIDTGQNYARLSKTVIKSKYYKIGLYSFCSLLNPILSLCSLDSSPQSQPKHTECQCHLYSANMFQIVSTSLTILFSRIPHYATFILALGGPGGGTSLGAKCSETQTEPFEFTRVAGGACANWVVSNAPLLQTSSNCPSLWILRSTIKI